MEALVAKYQHPILKKYGEMAKEVGGHGGMDFIMDSRLGLLPAERFAFGYGCIRFGRVVLPGRVRRTFHGQ